MIEADDAIKVVDTVAKNLIGVAKNKSNFERLPDSYWGYFARGHDSKGKFGVIITYSEDSDDVVQLIEMYQKWATNNKTKNKNQYSINNRENF
jgi:hypothetical protein